MFLSSPIKNIKCTKGRPRSKIWIIQSKFTHKELIIMQKRRIKRIRDQNRRIVIVMGSKLISPDHLPEMRRIGKVRFLDAQFKTHRIEEVRHHLMKPDKYLMSRRRSILIGGIHSLAAYTAQNQQRHTDLVTIKHIVQL